MSADRGCQACWPEQRVYCSLRLGRRGRKRGGSVAVAMLEVNNLKTHFKTQDGVVKAVDGVSFSLEPGETLGIVGESGSGKSVTALSIMQLNPRPQAQYPEGEILFEGQNLLEASDSRMQEIRGNDIAMIFQDPMTSLNPVFTVGNQIREAIRIHQNVSKSEAQERTIQVRSEEHTSELQSRQYLVCRLL